MATSWGLKKKLGLARLENDRVLLEFEFVGKVKRVLTSRKRLVGGLQLGLERWSLKTDCLEECEIRNEAWVKIVGLPISLWDPIILRRVREECGDFLAIDLQIERMKKL